MVSYRDAKEDREAILKVAADPDRGVRAEGRAGCAVHRCGSPSPVRR
ncbi:hypothetical protein P0F65_16555 [Sphingomonas sp. I4]